MNITEQTLSAWIDDGLSPKKMEAVSAAVAADPELKARADALRAVGSALRREAMDLPVSAERMAADVRREIRLQNPVRPRRISVWGWAGAAAAACLLIALLVVPSVHRGALQVSRAEIESVDSGLPGVSPMVYTDQESGWTIVWLDDAELESGI